MQGEMFPLEVTTQCPFCGEAFSIVVDPSEELQTYIEDCEVCCRPIHFTVMFSEGELVSIEASRD